MEKKCTADLLEQLSDKKISFEEFVKMSENDFVDNNYREFWFEIMEKNNLNKSDIINKANISYTYFYEIIRGDKAPTRDKLIRILLALKLDLTKCQQALKLYGLSELYAKNKRDSAVIFAINNDYSVAALNEMLQKNNLEALK